jgi:alpha-L-rhamnosidase
MVDIATAVGNTADATRYTALLAELKGKYHTAYFKKVTGTYGSSQTSNLLPLYLNITPPANVPGVVSALAKSVTKHKLGLLSGAMGTRYVFQALAQNGQASLALSIAADIDQPSFGYMALQGPAGGGLGTGKRFYSKDDRSDARQLY